MTFTNACTDAFDIMNIPTFWTVYFFNMRAIKTIQGIAPLCIIWHMMAIIAAIAAPIPAPFPNEFLSINNHHRYSF